MSNAHTTDFICKHADAAVLCKDGTTVIFVKYWDCHSCDAVGRTGDERSCHYESSEERDNALRDCDAIRTLRGGSKLHRLTALPPCWHYSICDSCKVKEG